MMRLSASGCSRTQNTAAGTCSGPPQNCNGSAQSPQDMNDTNETCAVCGKDLTNVSGVSHLYRDGKPFPLCCPLCIDLFQRAPARFASGERPQTLVEELLAKMKWDDSGRG